MSKDPLDALEARRRVNLDHQGTVIGAQDIDTGHVQAHRAGGRTSVPQIFIDGEHIGGSDELVALYRAGKLDP